MKWMTCQAKDMILIQGVEVFVLWLINQGAKGQKRLPRGTGMEELAISSL